jgi:hypothetical protein
MTPLLDLADAELTRSIAAGREAALRAERNQATRWPLAACAKLRASNLSYVPGKTRGCTTHQRSEYSA